MVPLEALKILKGLLAWPDVFLVGGGVRDILLGKEVKDFDLALPNPEQAFDRLAETGKRHGIILGQNNGQHCYRFLVETNAYSGESDAGDKEHTVSYFWLDLVKFKGGELLKDLALRDFTLNAMALPLKPLVSFMEGAITKAELLNELIDPYQGLADIKSKQIRAISPTVFQDDPLRLWRLWRFVTELNFEPHADLVRLSSESCNLCRMVPGERIRAELFALLRQPGSASCFAKAGCTGLLESQFPTMRAMRNCSQNEHHSQDVWNHSLQSLTVLENLLLKLEHYFPGEDCLNTVKEWLNDNNNLPVLKLAALFHDIGKPLVKSVNEDGRIHFYDHERAGLHLVNSIAARLCLSRRDSHLLAFLVKHHLQIQAVVKEASLRRQIRFWRAYGVDVIGLTLLGSADLLAKKSFQSQFKEAETGYIKIMPGFLDLWCCRVKDSFNVKALLNGTEIMQLFNIAEGPLVGFLKEAVREAQTEGTVTSKEEAMHYVSSLLSSKGGLNYK